MQANAEADTLNRTLCARAFTIGQDIFFRQGEYSPGGSDGRQLLAHELTHVLQQNGYQVQRQLAISQPGDKDEQEADRVRQMVMRMPEPRLQKGGTLYGQGHAATSSAFAQSVRESCADKRWRKKRQKRKYPSRPNK